MPINSEKVLSLYNYMKECGDDVGTWEHFKSKFFGDANYASRKKVFDALKDDPYADVGGSYEEFMTRLQRGAQRLGKAPAAQKQKQSTQVAAAQSQPSQQPQQPKHASRPMSESAVRSVYDELNASGDARGTYEQFRNNFVGAGVDKYHNRLNAYRRLKAAGANVPDTYEEFMRQYIVNPQQHMPSSSTQSMSPDEIASVQETIDRVKQFSDALSESVKHPFAVSSTRFGVAKDGLANGVQGIGERREWTVEDGKIQKRPSYKYYRTESGNIYDNRYQAYSEQIAYNAAKTDDDAYSQIAQIDKQIAALEEKKKTEQKKVDEYNPENDPNAKYGLTYGFGTLVQKGAEVGKVIEQINELKAKRAQILRQTSEGASAAKSIEDQLKHVQSALGDNYLSSNADRIFSTRRDQSGQNLAEYMRNINLQGAARMLTDAKKMMDEVNTSYGQDGLNGFFRGAGRGMGNGLIDVRTWDMGFVDLTDRLAYADVAAKWDRGENLTYDEQALLDAMATKMATDAYFASGLGRGYKAGQVTAQSIPFMLEMIINPLSATGKSLQAMVARYALKRFARKGLLNSGKEMTTTTSMKLFKTALSRTVPSALRKTAARQFGARAVTRVGGDALGAMGMAATTGQVRVLADALNRMTGQARYKIDQNGYVRYDGHDAPEETSMFKAYGKAFFAQSIENGSEMWSAYVPYLGQLFKSGLGRLGGKAASQMLGRARAASIRAFNKLPKADLISDFVQRATHNDIVDTLNGIRRRANLGGPIEEYMEEVMGNVANAIIVGDNDFSTEQGKGVFNLSDNIDTFLGVGLMTGAFCVAGAAGYRTPHYRAAKAIAQSDARGREVWGEQWDKFKADYAQCKTELDKQAIVTAFTNAQYGQKEKQAILQYVGAMQFMEGVQNGTWKKMQEAAEHDDERGTRRACMSSYIKGQNTTDAEGRRNAMLDLQNKEAKAKELVKDYNLYDSPEMYAQLNPHATEKQKKAMSDYAQAKARMDGIDDAMKYDHMNTVTRARHNLERLSNRQTGKVIEVELEGRDGHYYVRSGNIVVDDNGYVDHTRSDKTVVFVDQYGFPLSGSMDTSIIDGKPIVSEYEDVIKGIDNKARAKYNADYDAIEGKLSFDPGSTFNILDEDGKQHKAQITQDEQGQPIVQIDGAEDTMLLTDNVKDALQEKADLWQRMNYAGQIKAEEDAKAQADAEGEAASPSAIGQDSEVTYTDAEGNVHHGVVNGVTADGTYEIQFDQAPEGKSDVDTYTQDEIASMGIVPALTEEEAQAAAEGNADAVAPEASAEGQTDASATQNGVDDKQKVGNERKKTPKAIDRIPKDKKGKRNYEAAPVENTAAALIENANGDVDDAIETAGFMRKKTESLVEKAKADAEEAEDPETHQDIKNHIKVLEQNVKYWDDVVKFLEDVKKGAEEKAEEEAKAEAEAQAAEEAKAEGAEEAKAEEATEDVPASETEEEAKAPETTEEKNADDAKKADNKAVESEVTNADIDTTPTFLNVVHALYAKGKKFAEQIFAHKFFDVIKTPELLKKYGLTGEKFTIRYGVIARHFGKDSSHDLTEEDWNRLPEALQKPFAISILNDTANKKEKGYRIYTTLKNQSGEYVVVGVDVKNAGRNLEINAIATIFGRRQDANLPANETVIYESNEITPEQSSLLNRPNSDQYTTEQELSEDKVTESLPSVQEDDEEFAKFQREYQEDLKTYEEHKAEQAAEMKGVVDDLERAGINLENHLSDQTRKNMGQDGFFTNNEGGTTVFHGTQNLNLEVEDLEPGHRRMDGTSAGFNGQGVYFTPTKDNDYGNGHEEKILSCRLKMRKPFYLIGNLNLDGEQSKRFTEILLKHGYDAVIDYSNEYNYFHGYPSEIVSLSRDVIVPIDSHSTEKHSERASEGQTAGETKAEDEGKKGGEEAKDKDWKDPDKLLSWENRIIKEAIKRAFPDANQELIDQVFRDLNEKPLTDDDRKTMLKMGSAYGITVKFVDSLKMNGKFDKDSKTIYIAMNSDHPLAETFGHEFTHAVRMMSENDYLSMRDAVLAAYDGGNRKGLLDFIDMKYAEYAEDERTEEFVCDKVGEIINSRHMAQAILQQCDQPTIGKMRDAVNRMLAAARGVGNSVMGFLGVETKKPSEAEQKMDNLRQTILDAYRKARVAQKVHDTLSTGVETPDGKQKGAKYSTRAQVTGVGLTPIENDGHGNFAIMGSDGQVFDKEHPVTADYLRKQKNTPMSYLVNDALRCKATTQANVDMVYEKYAAILNAYLDKGSAGNGGFENLKDYWNYVGESVYKAVATNSDSQYSYSIDITRVCKKNEAVIDGISELQKRLGYGITPGQIMELYLETDRNGYQTPCPVCYVFSRYIRNGKYATIMINGQNKYGHLLVDPKTLSEEEKEKHIKFWLDEMERVDAENEENKKAISRANKEITECLSDIDKLSWQITHNKNLKPDELTALKSKVEAMDKRYRAAMNVVSQSSLGSWIKNFAIHKVKVKDKEKWVLYDDTFQGFPKEAALDFKQTARVMREYPAIQRYRNSRGAAAGKEITFAADNAIGDVPLALGSQAKTKELARPRDISEQEWEELKAADEYAEKMLGAENAYVAASRARTAKERRDLLNAARKRFLSAHVYAQQQTLRGGQRMWSWSDNIESLSNDVGINLMQLSLLGGALQSYTKQLEGAELVASMNGYVNCSLMGRGNGIREVSPDEIEYVDGVPFVKGEQTTVKDKHGRDKVLRSLVYQNVLDNKYYTLVFDNKVGIEPFNHMGEDGKRKLGAFDLNAQYDRAGNILVGMNDIHVRTAMADPRIFFIIPWHSSGANNHILAQMYNVLGVPFERGESTDYTDVQEEKRISDKEEEDEEEEVLNEDTGEMEKVAKPKKPRVSEHLRNYWEDHYNNRHTYGDRQIAGKDFRCGIEGGVKSADEVGDKLSESQLHYRELRRAIFTGIKVLVGKTKGGKNKYKTYDVKDYNPEWYREIMNDEFLSQVYNEVHDKVDSGFMTSTDDKFIYPYEYWDKSSTYETADVNTARYQEYCRRLGHKPKFCGMLDGRPAERNHGNFLDDKGAWKLLIDRRMYDTDGRYQDLTPVTPDGFDTDMIDHDRTAEKYDVTRVADLEATQGIVDNVLKHEDERVGGRLGVDYDMNLQSAVDAYGKAIAEADEVKESRRSPSSSELALRDAVVDRLRRSGLGVSIDGKEGQRVLDWANGVAREMRTYHGSGADFDHFDHSHMGEGEGEQAYGWGTYVTEVEGIGRTYANTGFFSAERRRKGKSDTPIDRAVDDIIGQEIYNSTVSNFEQRKAVVIKNLEMNISDFKKGLEVKDNKFLAFLKEDLERDKAELEALRTLTEEQYNEERMKQGRMRHLYTVEIPDDTGSNYLDWDKKYSTDEVYGIVDRIINSAINSENLKDYDNGEILRDAADRLAAKCDEYEQKGEVLTGEILYYIVHDNPKTASEILNSAGIVGMKYPADYRRGGRADGAKNYVIFNEKDAQITDHVRFFRGKDGEAYGFTVDGKIYLDPKKVNAETPIHEYAHLWSTALQQKDAKAWGDVVSLMKGTGVWDEVRENYPELETDDEIADEVLATYSGRKGAERLREEMRKVSESDGSLTEKAAAISALERVRNAISRFWRKVAEMLGFRYTKAEDVADHVLSDLLEGRNPNVGVETEGKAREQFIGEKGAASIDHAEEVNTRMDNLGVAREMEEAKKDAKTIKMATGWERGADGKWRYEVPDIKLKPIEEWLNKRKKFTLADIVEANDPMFEMYPKLKDIGIEKNRKPFEYGASYNNAENYIKLPFGGLKTLLEDEGKEEWAVNDFHSTLVHEVQHAIQYEEGFAHGGSPNSWSPDTPKEVIDEYESEWNQFVYLAKKYNNLNDFDRSKDSSRELRDEAVAHRDKANAIRNRNLLGKDGYHRLSGEVEARNVSKRMGMTPEERRASLASETEDVAREDQIFLGVKESKREAWKNPATMSEEEKAARGKQLMNAPAINVASKQIVKTEDKSARVVAEEWWKDNVGDKPLVYNTEIGEVEINQESIEGSLAHGYGQSKLDAITSVKDGFSNAVYLGTTPDFTRTKNDVHNHYFVYPINYDGNRNYVFCRAMEDNNKNRLYVHEVFVAENIQKKGNTLQTAAREPHGGIALYKSILANVLDAANVGNNSETGQESAEENETKESKRSSDLNAEYGTRWLDEQTNEDGRHTTQVKNTINSYKKFGEWVKRNSEGRKISVLDASSGLGLGTQWMRENGIDADDVEPYPSDNRQAPTYRSYDDIDKKYDYIISNAVLNVIPEDWREDVLHNMADKLKEGGKMVINVRSAESISKQGKEGATRVTLDEPSEILVLRPNGSIKAYQKGFTKSELKDWCEKELGDGYSVEIANNKNAGGSYDTAVVVTKNNGSTTDSVQSLSRDVEEGVSSLHDVTRDVKASLRNRNAAHTRVDGLAQAIYEKAVKGSDHWYHNKFEWDEAWHDSLKAVDELQKALVQERGKAISDIENVYLHAIHLSSVSANEMSEFRNHQVENLISAVHAIVNDRKLDVSQDELDIYLNAKHGPERNEFIARRKATEEADKKYGDDLKRLNAEWAKAAEEYGNNPSKASRDKMDKAKSDLDLKQKEHDDFADAQYKIHRLNDDYSGLTAIFQKPGEHLTNQELEQKANEYVADMEQKVGKNRIDNLWDAVKKANEFSLHKSYKAGLISKQQYEDTRKMYDWYVPLRGFKEDTAADVYDYVEHGTPHTQKAIRKAEGRVSRADEILANIMNMGSSAIINGNKNLVKQKLLVKVWLAWKAWNKVCHGLQQQRLSC